MVCCDDWHFTYLDAVAVDPGTAIAPAVLDALLTEAYRC